MPIRWHLWRWFLGQAIPPLSARLCRVRWLRATVAALAMRMAPRQTIPTGYYAVAEFEVLVQSFAVYGFDPYCKVVHERRRRHRLRARSTRRRPHFAAGMVRQRRLIRFALSSASARANPSVQSAQTSPSRVYPPDISYPGTQGRTYRGHPLLAGEQEAVIAWVR
jgi:hypothetical protein